MALPAAWQPLYEGAAVGHGGLQSSVRLRCVEVGRLLQGDVGPWFPHPLALFWSLQHWEGERESRGSTRFVNINKKPICKDL